MNINNNCNTCVQLGKWALVASVCLLSMANIVVTVGAIALGIIGGILFLSGANVVAGWICIGVAAVCGGALMIGIPIVVISVLGLLALSIIAGYCLAE